MPKDIRQRKRALCKATPRVSGFRVQPSAECPEGSKGSCIGLTVNQVGCVLWLIYKMSKLLEGRVLIYLRVIAKNWGVWGCESEGIKGAYTNS